MYPVEVGHRERHASRWKLPWSDCHWGSDGSRKCRRIRRKPEIENSKHSHETNVDRGEKTLRLRSMDPHSPFPPMSSIDMLPELGA